MSIRNSLTVLAVAIAVSIPSVFVSAESGSDRGKDNRRDATTLVSTDSALVQSLRNQIASLQMQVRELQQQLARAQSGVQGTFATTSPMLFSSKKYCREYEFKRNYKKGVTGEDIEALQEFLKESPDIYPEGLVTGYFGDLTERALQRFQSRYGTSTFSTSTDEILSLVRVKMRTKCVGNHHEGFQLQTRARVYDGNIFLCHKDGAGTESIRVGISSLRAHLAHGDRVGRCLIESSAQGDGDDGDDGGDDADDAESDDDTSMDDDGGDNTTSDADNSDDDTSSDADDGDDSGTTDDTATSTDEDDTSTDNSA